MVVCRIQVVAEEVETEKVENECRPSGVGYREWLLGLRRAILLRIRAEELDVRMREAKMALRRQIDFYSQVRKVSSTPPRRLTKGVSDVYQAALTSSGVRGHFAASSTLETKRKTFVGPGTISNRLEGSQGRYAADFAHLSGHCWDSAPGCQSGPCTCR